MRKIIDMISNCADPVGTFTIHCKIATTHSWQQVWAIRLLNAEMEASYTMLKGIRELEGF